MKVTKLTPNISVAHQLTAQDFEEAAAAGFKTIINNRPDGEAPDQPPSEELADAAKRLSLAYHHIPAVSGQISNDQVEAFRTALGGAAKPALAFCRTGTRSTTLWALAASDRLSANEILQTTSEAGYNLEALRPQLEDASKKETFQHLIFQSFLIEVTEQGGQPFLPLRCLRVVEFHA